MDKGRQVLEDNPRRLLQQNIEAYVLEVPVTDGGPALHASDLPSGVRVDHAQASMRFYAQEIDQLKGLVDRLADHPYYLRQTTLEDVFLKATGRALNEKQ
jgi:lipooligosaccharide transport system ATP-binding protein